MNVVVTTKLAYNVTLEECGDSDPPFWEKSIWHWRIPLKLKIFIWLSLNNKALTCDNLQKQNKSRTGRCVLCKANEENINHFLILCTYYIYKTGLEGIQCFNRCK